MAELLNGTANETIETALEKLKLDPTLIDSVEFTVELDSLWFQCDQCDWNCSRDEESSWHEGGCDECYPGDSESE